MPKSDDIRTVLIIGAGPIVIGQACEFDYAGTQACRALRDEGLRVVLLNSNPATIMTDPDFADATYIEPVDAATAARIIRREKADAVLPTMGGQAALNCALELEHSGALKACGARLIGASAAAIAKAENRELFKKAMAAIGLKTPRSAVARGMDEATAALAEIGFPIIVRPSFTLGGSGGGIAYNDEEFADICGRGLAASPTHEILIEQSLIGWKEFEMEVVRDRADNCIIVCAIENLDPMGIHTGDSITVAPAQTLTDKEYQLMRDAAIAVLREIGVDTGGSNVQFAINPANGDMAVIEMNPRVSRSSALASKATGFPIAKVAARLAVGRTLDEIANDITGGKTPASFEPAIDYAVVKIPRFTFEKFPQTPDALTTQMKSVGEVMAIGRTFAEALQKALRGLEIGVCGLNPLSSCGRDEMEHGLANPGSRRIFQVADGFRAGLSVAEIARATGIDPWFLTEIAALVEAENRLRGRRPADLSADEWRELKRAGFADARIAELAGGVDESAARAARWKAGVHPVYKRVDSCAGEFPTDTSYLYSTYEDEDELYPAADRRKMMILGGGPNRIGQGIEFDYCCIHAALALREAGFETLMVNCNPETVSTDYDISDRLFFEPLTAEDVLEIVRREKPEGIIVQFGGQTPLRIARAVEAAAKPILGKSPIIGTSVDAIDCAEDRRRFQRLLKKCGLRQPPNAVVSSAKAALQYAARADSFPLLARPSYVLGGRAMEILYRREELADYFARADAQTVAGGVLLDKFLDDAIEVDVDAACDGKRVIVGGVMEHIEQAGVHSGDSACSLPPHTLSPKMIAALQKQTATLARALGVVGLINIQFAICGGEIYVLEVNPRASRTAPFVSKATGLDLAKVAARAMAGISFAKQKVKAPPRPPYFSVKEAVFPFEKFPGADVLLGPEMKSTGEVMGIGATFAAAFCRAQSAIYRLPSGGGALFSVRDQDKPQAADIARRLAKVGFKIYATAGTAAYFRRRKIAAEAVNKVAQGRPHVVDLILSDQAQIVVNTVERSAKSVRDSFSIRQSALQRKVVYSTTVAGGDAASRGIADLIKRGDARPMPSLQERHRLLKKAK